jgi:uncharacterized membrane protein YdjX (TVP38/TMEM64 family)
VKPDLQVLLAWLFMVALIAISLFGAWMMSGENMDGLMALFERLEQRSLERPWSTAAAFALLFTIATALTLPAATLLCVCAGYLFGTLTGTLVSVAGGIGGAAVTFVLVRFLAGERVRDFLMRGKTGNLVQLLERDAFFYLVAFRIVPVAPFFAINAAGALLRITTRRYLLATGLGLAPITLIYASVGAGLETLIEAGTVRGPSVMLQPRVLLPLLALVLVLIAGGMTRRAVRRRRRRRA